MPVNNLNDGYEEEEEPTRNRSTQFEEIAFDFDEQEFLQFMQTIANHLEHREGAAQSEFALRYGDHTDMEIAMSGLAMLAAAYPALFDEAELVGAYPALFDEAELLSGGNKAEGASKAEIDALPTRAYTDGDLGCASCTVCLVDYVDQDALKQLPCKHAFHIACIDEWLLLNASCPNCRASIKPV